MVPHTKLDDIVDQSSSSVIKNSNQRSISKSELPRPLHGLSVLESDQVRDAVLKARGTDAVIKFHTIYLSKPIKKELVAFLEAEHSGTIGDETPRPATMLYKQTVPYNTNSPLSILTLDTQSITDW